MDNIHILNHAVLFDSIESAGDTWREMAGEQMEWLCEQVGTLVYTWVTCVQMYTALRHVSLAGWAQPNLDSR